MLAALFDGADRPLRIGRLPDPEPGPADLILRVRACGVCGSDLHISELCDTSGGMPPPRPGIVLGHEFAGEVVEVGATARNQWRIGDRVTALPYIGCGYCDDCAAGKGYRCGKMRFCGSNELNGAYAEYVRVGHHETLRLPENIDFRTGALVEPLAVGLRAVMAADLRPRDSVLVVGAGPVGLAVSLWCRFFGARHIVVSDRAAARAERAGLFGASLGVDAAREDVTEAFVRLAGGRPAVVFDCVGLPGTQQLCVDYAAAEGRVIIAGLCMRPDAIVPANAMRKELTIRYVYMHRRQDFEFTLEMLACGRLDASRMTSEVVGFSAFPAAFEALKRPTTQTKVLLDPALA